MVCTIVCVHTILRDTRLRFKMGLPDAYVRAALCGIQIVNYDDFNVAEEQGGATVKAMVISQFIRQRLPANAILCRLPGSRACILFASRDKAVLHEQISGFLQAPDASPVAGMVFPQKMELISSGLRLEGQEATMAPELLLEKVMGQLAEGNAISSFIR